jgi:hypothetical protein
MWLIGILPLLSTLVLSVVGFLMTSRSEQMGSDPRLRRTALYIFIVFGAVGFVSSLCGQLKGEGRMVLLLQQTKTAVDDTRNISKDTNTISAKTNEIVTLFSAVNSRLDIIEPNLTYLRAKASAAEETKDLQAAAFYKTKIDEAEKRAENESRSLAIKTAPVIADELVRIHRRFINDLEKVEPTMSPVSPPTTPEGRKEFRNLVDSERARLRAVHEAEVKSLLVAVLAVQQQILQGSVWTTDDKSEATTLATTLSGDLSNFNDENPVWYLTDLVHRFPSPNDSPSEAKK